MKALISDVAIVGAGFVGIPLAVALAKHGLSVTILDRREADAPLVPDGRSSAVALGPKRMLDAIGLWPQIEPFAAPILEIRVTDGGSRRFLHYDYQDVGDEPLGWIVENHQLLGALRQALAETEGARLLAPAIPTGLRQDKGRIVLDLQDGREVRTLLAVAADGRASALRQMAGIGVVRREYRQSAISCIVAHEREHGNIAHERFQPAGPFAILPLPGRRSSIVWTERTDLARAIMAAEPALFLAELEDRFGDFLGALSLEGERSCSALSLQWAKNTGATRLALVGDALHGMHPVAGQGMNMGLRDVAALAQVVVEARRLGLDIGSAEVSTRYARWRRFDNLLMLGLTDGLVRLFSNDMAPLALARDVGLAAVDRLPLAKRFFMRHAMGLAGTDLPRLFEGKGI